jgi:hypothetical protein
MFRVPFDQPGHLRQLPEEDVARVVSIIVSECPHMPYGLGEELKAFAETRTVHDARRLANALRRAYSREGLAREVEDHPATSLARTMTELLAGMTRYRLAGLSPQDRIALLRECERVARDIKAESNAATAPRSGVLADLTDPRGRQ